MLTIYTEQCKVLCFSIVRSEQNMNAMNQTNIINVTQMLFNPLIQFVIGDQKPRDYPSYCVIDFNIRVLQLYSGHFFILKNKNKQTNSMSTVHKWLYPFCFVYCLSLS